MTISDVFTRAAELIERHGWCQNRSFDSFGRIDARDAVWAAGCEGELPRSLLVMADHTIPYSERTTEAIAALKFLRSYLSKQGYRGGITGWNDDPRRTQGDVLRELRSAARLASAGSLT